MKAKTRTILEIAISQGILLGYGRAFKHDPNPSEERIQESIMDQIMNSIDEYFDFESWSAVSAPVSTPGLLVPLKNLITPSVTAGVWIAVQSTGLLSVTKSLNQFPSTLSVGMVQQIQMPVWPKSKSLPFGICTSKAWATDRLLWSMVKIAVQFAK